MTEFRTGVIRPIECFKEGWEIIKDDYWLLFAISLVGGLIGGFSMYILLGAMCCGIYYVYLQKIDGKPVVFDNLWVGFQKIVPSLVVTLIIIIPVFALYILMYAPFIAAGVMGSKLNSDELTALFVGAIGIDIVLAVIMTCLHSLLIFTFPLIIDRNLDAVDAIKTSAKAVWQNLGGVVGLFVVAIVGSIVITMITCGIGAYFLMPVMFAGIAVAYRKVFPAVNTPNFNPPPPSAFPGAGGYNL